MNAVRHALPRDHPGFAFGRFVLRRRERLLMHDGVAVTLGSRAIEVLLALLDADGVLLTKDDIMDRVWPDVIVTENSLQVQISVLRRALGPEGRDWIATIAGRGYHFVGPITGLTDPAPEMRGAVLAMQAPISFRPDLSVLILPFVGHGADPAGAWFADGLTDSLTTDLARILPAGSRLVARTSADTYKERAADVREIGREQGVRYVVEGSVLLAEDQVRVNAQLVAAETGAHLWADRFDTPRRDTLQAQDEIVGRLARSINLELVYAEAQRAEHADGAQEFVLRARAEANGRMRTRESFDAACLLYERALDIEPLNTDALAGMAHQRIAQVINGNLEKGSMVRDDAAREAHLVEAENKLARALAAAPGHLEALRSRALLLRARGLFADAALAANAVLARTPGDPTAHREIGLNLLYLGRTEEAVSELRRADALGPDDPARWTWLQGLGRALMQLGRDAEAADTLRLAVANNPARTSYHALLAAALVLAGEDAQATVAMAEFRRTEPDTPPEILARRSAVPYEATDPNYRIRNGRVREGLLRAAAL